MAERFSADEDSKDDRYIEVPSRKETDAITHNESGDASNLVSRMFAQRMRFDALSVDVIQDLLRERKIIRDKNHKEIMSEITDVSGEIASCNNRPYSFEAQQQKPELARTRANLEKMLRDEDVACWRDTEELRQALVAATKKCENAQIRAELIFPEPAHNEDKKRKNTIDSE